MQALKYGEEEFDLNALINFEMLKKLIEAIAKKQFELNKTISSIPQGGFNLNMTNYLKEGGAEYTSEFDKLLKESEIAADEVNDKDIAKRLTIAERHLKKFDIVEKWLRNLDKKTQFIAQSMEVTNFKVKEMDECIESNKTEIEELKIKLNDLNEKVEDMTKKFGDYNMITSLPENNTDGNASTPIDLINNSETKFFKKFSFYDEKLKKVQDDIFKMQKELFDSKTKSENTSATLISIQNQLEQLDSDLNEEKEKNDNIISEINKKIKELPKQQIQRKESEESKVKNESSKQSQQHKKGKDSGDLELEWNQIQDNTKMIELLEKKINAIPETIKLREINSRIKMVENEVSKQLTKGDLEEIKDKIALMENLENDLRDITSQQSESNAKRNQDISALAKRIESIHGILLLLQSEGAIQSRGPQGGSSSGVDSTLFNDTMKNINKAILSLQKESDEFRRYFNDILPLMQKVASIDDLKNLEEVLKALLEEYKLMANKKFADKIETSKNFKLIETQIKHVVAESMKKMEKGGDNWMLAAKPVGGYKCASCESYIGELNNKWEYLPWNKYPTREFTDKSYRMGNGFSRMLQNLTLDLRRNEDVVQNISFSGDEATTKENEKRDNSAEKQKRKNILPKVKTNLMHLGDDVSKSQPNAVGTSEKGKEEAGNPKVIKVYKKVKNSSEITEVSKTEKNAK